MLSIENHEEALRRLATTDQAEPGKGGAEQRERRGLRNWGSVGKIVDGKTDAGCGVWVDNYSTRNVLRAAYEPKPRKD